MREDREGRKWVVGGLRSLGGCGVGRKEESTLTKLGVLLNESWVVTRGPWTKVPDTPCHGGDRSTGPGRRE